MRKILGILFMTPLFLLLGFCVGFPIFLVFKSGGSEAVLEVIISFLGIVGIAGLFMKGMEWIIEDKNRE